MKKLVFVFLLISISLLSYGQSQKRISELPETTNSGGSYFMIDKDTLFAYKSRRISLDSIANYVITSSSYWGRFNGTLYPVNPNDSVRLQGTGELIMGTSAAKTAGNFLQYSSSGAAAQTLISGANIQLQDWDGLKDRIILTDAGLTIYDYISGAFQSQCTFTQTGLELGNNALNFTRPVELNLYKSSTHDNTIKLKGETGDIVLNGGGIDLVNFMNEFSTDGTLSGNSNIAVPTEQAVKTYADNLSYSLSDVLAVGNKTLGNNINISSGDNIGFGANQQIYVPGNYLELTNDIPSGEGIRFNTLNGLFDFDSGQLDALNTSTNQEFKFDISNDYIGNVNLAGFEGRLLFNQTASRVWTLPDLTGTLALTSDIYWDLSGGVITAKSTSYKLKVVNTPEVVSPDSIFCKTATGEMGMVAILDPSFQTGNIGNSISGGLDTLWTSSAYLGNYLANDYTHFKADGSLIMSGAARKYRTVHKYAYDIIGIADTYNGIIFDASALFSIGTPATFITRGFRSGNNQEDAVLTNLAVPLDYEDGTDVYLTIDWTSNATTGSAFYGIGYLFVGIGDDVTASHTFITGVASAPAISFDLESITLTIPGTGIETGDDVSIVMYRDPDNVNDDMLDLAHVTGIRLKYVSNKIGGDL